MATSTECNQVIKVVIRFRVVDTATKGASITVDMMGVKVDCPGVVAKLARKAVAGSGPGSWMRSPSLPHRLSASLATRLANVFPVNGGFAAVAAESGADASLIERHPIPDISLAALLTVCLAAVCEWATALGADTLTFAFLVKFSRVLDSLIDTTLTALSARLGFSFMTAIALCHDYLLPIQYYTSGKSASLGCRIAET